MDLHTNTLAPQFLRRASTAKFIVDLEGFFYKHDTVLDVGGHKPKPLFTNLPAPPDHLDREAVEECRAIASMLTLAQRKRYQVTWDAESYGNDLCNVVLLNDDVEDRLMVKYPPLIGIDGVLKFHGNNLPVVLGPAIVTDIKDRVLLWYLPDILSARRQSKILAATCCLEAQLTAPPHHPEDPNMKSWCGDDTLFNPGLQWKSGSTLLYPVGFEPGHTGPQFRPAPSVDVKTARAHDWMVEFEESGGLLDGILAVTHPALYAAAQDLMTQLSTMHPPSMFVMQTWPSSFTSIEVISNHQAPLHRNMGSMPGWLNLLLSLGSYGKHAVLEVRILGISLPYNSGTVASLSSKLLLHGVPTVDHDRVSYALHLNKAVFEFLKLPLPAMAIRAPPALSSARQPTRRLERATDLREGGSNSQDDGDGTAKTARDGTGEDGSAGASKYNGGGDVVGGDWSNADGEGSGTDECSDGDESGGLGDAEGSSNGEIIGSDGTEDEDLTDVEMLGDQSAA